MFRVGIHRGQWPAFVQAEDFHVNRLDSSGNVRFVDFGDFGIHLHSGGPGMAVDHYSAGCQVIWSPEGYFAATWHHFFDPAVAAMRSAQQSLMPYMLLDEADLLKKAASSIKAGTLPATKAAGPARGMEITSPAMIGTILVE